MNGSPFTPKVFPTDSQLRDPSTELLCRLNLYDEHETSYPPSPVLHDIPTEIYIDTVDLHMPCLSFSWFDSERMTRQKDAVEGPEYNRKGTVEEKCEALDSVRCRLFDEEEPNRLKVSYCCFALSCPRGMPSCCDPIQETIYGSLFC